MHGAGNDYIYVDTLSYTIENPSMASRLWSDRHKGIGSDGLVLIGHSSVPEADFTMNVPSTSRTLTESAGVKLRTLCQAVNLILFSHETSDSWFGILSVC